MTVVPGDGIGPEVTRAACSVLEATGVELQWETVSAEPVHREAVPDTLLDSIRSTTIALKGPLTTIAGSQGRPSRNVALRRILDLFAQVRPCRTRPGLRTPFPAVDLVIVRGTTEDLYAGIEFAAGAADTAIVLDAINAAEARFIDRRSALSIKPLSEAAARRLLTFAFDYASRVGYRHVTAVHKATAMRCTDGLFLEVAHDVASGYPEILFDDRLVDVMCAELVRRPGAFGVIATLPMYGDILSDLAAALAGGIGLAPGANFGPQLAVFEAAHGSAPSHGGMHRANPMAMILTGALLLRHIGEESAADAVEGAVDKVLADGRTLTYDLCDQSSTPATTEEVAQAIAEEVAQRVKGS